LRAGQSETDAAWQDLLASHRLARLVSRGGTLIDLLVGIAIDGLAFKADLAFLDHTNPNAKQLRSCLRELQALPRFDITAPIDLGERFTVLETILLIDRHGMKYLEALAGGTREKSNLIAESVLDDIDWDPAFQIANRMFDRIVTILRVKERAEREKKLDRLDTELKALKANLAEGLGPQLLVGSPKEKGEMMGNVLTCLLLPAFQKVHQSAERARQIQDNVLLAFALAQYQRDQGSYPKELAMLTPKYLNEIPKDLFSGKALAYRPQENGYFLYSVGVNGKDEQGRGAEDNPPGDDLSVRMPLPPLPRK
jgi:hypothetical protein